MCVVDCAALICASNAEDETDPRFVGCCDGVSCVGLMWFDMTAGVCS